MGNITKDSAKGRESIEKGLTGAYTDLENKAIVYTYGELNTKRLARMLVEGD